MTKILMAGLALAPVVIPALAFAQAAPAMPQAAPGPILQQSAEYRFQLDLHVNDAVLAKLLPAGWVSAMATQGPAKDANLRLIFVDEQDIVGADGKVAGKGANRIAMLAAPVKTADGSQTGQMILGGIAEDGAVPDAFGVYLTATTATMTRSVSDAGGMVACTDDWNLQAAGGEHFRLHLKYVRGPANKGGGDTKFFNPANPAEFQTARTEQATDITRNATTNPSDRVQEFSLQAGGGKYAALFDGTERPLSWDSQPTYSRIVFGH